jgi:hypothetical protein
VTFEVLSVALIALIALVIMHNRLRLPAGVLGFYTVIDSDPQIVKLTGWTVVKTVTIEGNAHPTELRIWRGRRGLWVRGDVLGSGREPMTSETPLSVKTPSLTMAAGISVRYTPKAAAR